MSITRGVGRAACGVLMASLLISSPGCQRKPPRPADPPPATRGAVAPPPPEPEPAPKPATPRLLSEQEGRPAIEIKLERAADLLEQLGTRPLDDLQREHHELGASLVGQARQAFDDEDLARADNLIDKALILIEELERETRDGRAAR